MVLVYGTSEVHCYKLTRDKLERYKKEVLATTWHSVLPVGKLKLKCFLILDGNGLDWQDTLSLWELNRNTDNVISCIHRTDMCC